MNLYELFVKIGLKDEASDKIGGIGDKVDGFGKKLSGIGGKIEGTVNKLNTAFQPVVKAGKVAVTALATAVTSASAAFAASANAAADYGDNIDKMYQKMGLTAEAYQEWDAVMQHSGTSIEAMQASMKTLANAAETGNEAFQRLGITQEQLANMNQQEIFEATIAGLQNVSDTTERTYLAGKLLGRGATELGALLNTSAEDTQKMRDEVHKLGGVMSNDAVKAAARYKDSLQDMTTAFSGLQRNLSAEFLPAMADVMDGLGKIFSGQDGGIELITQGVDNFISKLNETIPKAVEAGGKILKAIGKAILDNLPEIAGAGGKIIASIVGGLIKAIPQLVAAAPQIIRAFIDAILEAFRSMFGDTVGEIIGTVVTSVAAVITAVSGISKIISAAKIIKNLANIKAAIAALTSPVGLVVAGIVALIAVIVLCVKHWDEIKAKASEVIDAIKKKIDELKEAAREKLENIKQFFKDAWNRIKEFFSDAWNIGSDIVNNILSGISSAWGTLVGWVSGAWNSIKSIFTINESDVHVSSSGRTHGGTSGGFAGGLDYVPYNGFSATLHKGESVLTAREAEQWRNGNGGYTAIPEITAPVNINVTETIDGMTLASRLYKYQLKVDQIHGVRLINA